MGLVGKVQRDTYGVEIAVYGLATLERAMRSVTPDVGRAMNTSIRQALNASRDTARSMVFDQAPMSGWSLTGAKAGKARGGAGWPAWNPGKARSGITVGKGQARGTRSQTQIGVAWRLQSTDAAATIFDKTAEGHSRVGAQFVENLNRRGRSQRLLWPAWLKTRRIALAEIEAAINRAQAEFQKRIDAIDGKAS